MNEEHIKLKQGNTLRVPNELEEYVERVGVIFPCEVDVLLQEGQFTLYDVTYMDICDHYIILYTGAKECRRAGCVYQVTSFDIAYNAVDRRVTLAPYNSMKNNYHGQDL